VQDRLEQDSRHERNISPVQRAKGAAKTSPPGDAWLRSPTGPMPSRSIAALSKPSIRRSDAGEVNHEL
jgi:hypothetical protein